MFGLGHVFGVLAGATMATENIFPPLNDATKTLANTIMTLVKAKKTLVIE